LKILSVARTIFLTSLLNCWLSPVVSAEDQASAPGLAQQKPESEPSVATDRGYMTCYSEQIPGTEITFEMIPVPGGTFLLGSPDDEPQRNPDEGPRVRVQVAPFWIGKCEITWAEYHAYMEMYEAFKTLDGLRADRENPKIKSLQAVQEFLSQESADVDAVTSPTPLYDSSFTYEVGEEPEQPAVTMTQFAAKQYTKWLSGIMGRQYCLPTEAEWEYAARAGTSTAFSFGDNSQELGEYAWYAANADEQTHAVGTKKPNAWGLYDMHGNVAEWVLDQYAESYHLPLKEGPIQAENAIVWPTKLFPRVIRGGCWFDDPKQCRSAARHKSADPDWNVQDPNLPKSPWWFTEEPATGVGFRLVRPLQPMDPSLKQKVWDADIDWIRQDVADRLDEGRGVQSAVDTRLPAAIQEIEAAGFIE